MKTNTNRFGAHAGRTARRGFTLIEILVTLAIVAALVAVLFPIILRQLDEAEPARVASDLASIRTGIETFHLNVRPKLPGDLEDLVHEVSPGLEADAEGNNFLTVDANRWRGPYLDLSTPEVNVAGQTATGDAAATGFDGQIQLEIERFESAANRAESTSGFAAANADWVVVTILDLSQGQFEDVNELIDGTEASPSTTGRLRFTSDRDGDGTANDAAVWYLAVPYRP